MMKFNICYVAAIVCNGLHIFSNVSRNLVTRYLALKYKRPFQNVSRRPLIFNHETEAMCDHPNNHVKP